MNDDEVTLNDNPARPRFHIRVKKKLPMYGNFANICQRREFQYDVISSVLILIHDGALSLKPYE